MQRPQHEREAPGRPAGVPGGGPADRRGAARDALANDDSLLYSASLYYLERPRDRPMQPDNSKSCSDVSVRNSSEASRTNLRREAGRLNLNQAESRPALSVNQALPFPKSSNSFLTRVRDSFRRYRRVAGGSGAEDCRLPAGYRLGPPVPRAYPPALEINDEVEEDVVIADPAGKRKKEDM